MPRRNASDASGRHPRPERRRTSEAATTAPPPSPRVVTQQKSIPKFFAIAPDVTSRCGNLLVRPARYCSDACRAAVDRARDRERKWLLRNREVGRFKRRLEYQAARAKRCWRSALFSTALRSRTVFGPAAGAYRLRS